MTGGWKSLDLLSISSEPETTGPVLPSPVFPRSWRHISHGVEGK